MSGWLLLVLLIVAVAAGLWLLGVRGAMLKLSMAALLVGASGYAWQGRPSLGGASAPTAASTAAVPLTNARRAFYGQFAAHEHWMIISDSYARRGKKTEAANVLVNAVQSYPDDPSLWVGLGNALVEQAGVLTPPAELAYRRAAELSPGHPAPAFFYGLALLRSGDAAAAYLLWQEVLAGAPADASWRPLVEDAVAALQQPASPAP